MSPPAARARALAALISVLASSSAATAACPRPLVEWARACSEREGLRARASECRPDRAALDVTLPSERLLFELRADGVGFVTESGVGISPVGQFSDWKAEPAPRRDALAAVQRCARAAAPPLGGGGAHELTPTRRRPTSLVTTTTVAATVGLAITLALASRQVAAIPLALAVLASLAAAALRWWWLGAAYFHQNGQGPLWTAAAGHASPYGPGYDEWMALAARLGGAHAERAMFAANAAFGALAAALGFAVARIASGSMALAWLTLALLALDPVGARVSGSESYFAIQTTLAWSATLAVVLATHGPPRERRAALLGAALLVAASARVHPIGWAPLAPLALVPLARRRGGAARLAGVAAVTIALGVAALAGPAMWAVLQGPIGAQWARASSLRARDGVWLALAVGAAVLAASRGRARAGGAALLALGWTGLTYRVDGDDPLVSGAYLRLAAPPIAACALALATGRASRRVIGAGAVACALAGLPAAMSRARTRSTDAIETTRALEWRERLREDDDVCFVSRAGRAIFSLPLGAPWARSTAIDPSRIWSTDGCTHYYRSALCSTTDADDACEQVEAGLRLEAVDLETLPARPSLPWLRYRTATVDVGLYRVVDVTPRAR